MKHIQQIKIEFNWQINNPEQTRINDEFVKNSDS